MTEHPDQPVYLVPINKHWFSHRSTVLELARLLFREDLRVVQMPDGIGCLSIADRDLVKAWSMRPKAGSDEIFPGFRDMYEDIRNTGLRLAKFDIFYGFNRQTNSGINDNLVDFYVNVMDAVKYRFYAVPQYFDLRLSKDESWDEKWPNAWMFYFEDENDHLVFSTLVDIELQKPASEGRPLFDHPPKRDEVDQSLYIANGSVTTALLSANSALTANLQFAPVPKPTITGHLTHNPDGTVTLTGV